MSKPVCVIAGVGPGNGSAFARKFAAEGYRIALLSRSEALSGELARELADARAYRCDLSDAAATRTVFEAIRKDMGAAAVLVYNAGSGQWGTPEETTPADMEQAWRVNVLGCLTASQSVVPGMIEGGGGAVVVIGATASWRGGARATAFASAKAAQRSLAQSLARHLGPQGVHVGYVIIDGVIDIPRTRARLADKPDEFFLKPSDIAESVYHLARQPRSAWTFELDLRPFGERW